MTDGRTDKQTDRVPIDKIRVYNNNQIKQNCPYLHKLENDRQHQVHHNYGYQLCVEFQICKKNSFRIYSNETFRLSQFNRCYFHS